MLKEAFSLLIDLGKQSVSTQLVGLPGGGTLLVRPDRTTEVLPEPPEYGITRLTSIESLVLWAGENQVTEVFVKHGMIEAYANRSKKSERRIATVELHLSTAMLALQAWFGTAKRQQSVVRDLRSTLADTFDSRYLAVFRSLDFTRRNDGSRKIGHTGESLGKSIESAAQSQYGEVPERMTFSVPLWSFDGAPRVAIQTAIEIDAENETIYLMPVGDTVAQATNSAIAAMVETLRNSLPETFVYRA